MVSAQQEQRMIKSEHNSPNLGSSNLAQLNGQLPPLDLSGLEGFADFNYPISFDAYPSLPEVDQPIFSAGLSAASVDWSHYDGLDFNNDNFATSEFSQAPSFNGFDFGSIDHPALTTTSTSGEISEVEDFGQFSDHGRPLRPVLSTQKYGSDFDASDVGEIDAYRLSTASSYMGLPQAQMLASNDIGSLDIDDFLKGVATNNGYVQPNTSHGLPSVNYSEETKYLQMTPPYDDCNFQLGQFSAEEEDGLWINDFASSNTMPIVNGSSETPLDNVWSQ
jgi:hypothetical protein